MVLFRDFDPSTLSAGYNIIHVPIERLGVAYRETISRFRFTYCTPNRFLGLGDCRVP